VKPGIDHLIINSPFEEPNRHWAYERELQRFNLKDGRRPAGYVRATPGRDSFDDPGIFIPLELPNQIRHRVHAWREAGWPGVTGTTRRLLEHWIDPENFDQRRFFFCQLEAIETLIWLTETSAADRQGIDVPGDGGTFCRLCAKMATGSGKTIVMAMAIAWHVLNKVSHPQDRRFSKYVLVVAPGLTVRNRLLVLDPPVVNNYYDRFDIVPAALRDKLRQGKVLVRNWHTLAWDSEERLKKKRSVDKRGAKSDEAYVRDVLGNLARAHNLLVINDEAHHAWRLPAEEKAGATKAEFEEATVWVGGLDRIHRSRGILTAYDFSATPFIPSGRRNSDETLFGWIVSDFGLSDAIEAGLVKTPRVVVRDDGVPDAKTYRSKLFHIYPHVSGDLNRKAEEHEPLPDLVTNAYYLLGKDWLETQRDWVKAGSPTPPVMITVANRTETAARVRRAFETKRVLIEELCDRDRLLHIDSKVLEMAEQREDTGPAEGLEGEEEGDNRDEAPVRRLTRIQEAERLRLLVDTVGQPGKAGAPIQNVISVGMLSEGWDAKTVTHIMGLRAFTSQLLCEQVVGRGLRRTSYELNRNNLFDPEFVNVFGVPFTFLPHETEDGETAPPPPKPRTRIEPIPDRREFEITWPNVIRINPVYETRLTLDIDGLEPLQLDAANILEIAQLAPTVDGKPDLTKVTEIDLEEIGRRSRLQTIAFRAAAELYDQVRPGWPGSREVLLGQVIAIVERFLASDRIHIEPGVFSRDPLRRRILLTLSMGRIVQHLFEKIRHESVTGRKVQLDQEHPIRRTGDMPAWYTVKPCAATERSHINFAVFDSTWEASEAFHLDRDPHVVAWVKNDHLGFEVYYVFQGTVRKFRPDYLIRLVNGVMLVLEVKGQDTPQDQTKREFLAEWVEAVNEHGGFGRWASAVSLSPSSVAGLLASHATEWSQPCES
jgi:type III restriction enzyme